MRSPLPDLHVTHLYPDVRRLLIGGLFSGVGSGMTRFAVALQIWLALVLVVIAGAADLSTVTYRSTIVQVVTPADLLGRVSSVEFVGDAAGAPLGSIESGAVAAFSSPLISAFTSGVACFAGVLAIAACFPALVRYRAYSDARLLVK